MKQTILLLIFSLLGLSVACSPAGTNLEPEATNSSESIMIRIHNSSQYTFDSVEIGFPQQTEQYGALPPGSSSNYRAVSQAYRYAYVRVTMGEQELILQPIDYVGESLLAPGQYTYVLDMTDDTLGLIFVAGDGVLESAPTSEAVAVEVERPTPTTAPLTQAPTVDLNGSQWQIIAYGAPDRPAAVQVGTQPTAEFKDGQLHGSTGCNSYFATYSQSGDTLTVGPVGSTRMGCDQALAQQEVGILLGWETAVTYEVHEDTLIVHHENGVLVLVAETAAPTTEPATQLQDEPAETILILSPGPGSQVTSPVIIAGESDYAFEGTLAVEIVSLAGETAVPLGTGFAMLNVPEIGQRGPYSGQVSFTPPAEATPGRISVYMISARDGHIQHLTSVIVTLLPAGETADLRTADPHPETIAIQSPAFLSTISGGTVQITGIASSSFEQNLAVEIINEVGDIVGQGFVTIDGEMGQRGPFTGEASYSVTSTGQGSICLTDYSMADGGILHRTCQLVTLAP